MTDAVRWADEICLLPYHAEDLVCILFGARRHAVRASDAESMINFRVQCWWLYQALLGRGAQRMKARLFLV
jgi:hypothetical protein